MFHRQLCTQRSSSTGFIAVFSELLRATTTMNIIDFCVCFLCFSLVSFPYAHHCSLTPSLHLQSSLQLYPAARSWSDRHSLLAGRPRISALSDDVPRHQHRDGRDWLHHGRTAEEGEEGGGREEKDGGGTGWLTFYRRCEGEFYIEIESSQTPATVFRFDVAERICAQHAEDRECRYTDEPGVSMKIPNSTQRPAFPRLQRTASCDLHANILFDVHSCGLAALRHEATVQCL